MPKQIGEILVDRGLINSDQLQEALEEQRMIREFIGRILIRRGYIKEDSLLEALSSQFDVPYLSIKNRYIDSAVVRKFPYSLILKYKCFPLEQDESSVTVAVTNPLDAVAIGEMERAINPLKLEVILTSRDDMAEVIGRYRQYRDRFIRGLIGKTER